MICIIRTCAIPCCLISDSDTCRLFKYLVVYMMSVYMQKKVVGLNNLFCFLYILQELQ